MKKILQKIKAGSIKNRPKVFCVSMQRTGTTSVGQFFKDFGFAWSGWPDDKRNKWSVDWFDGNFDKIFSSEDFAKANAYEDSPWFFPEFYKFLYHKFPNSKFILFKRDPQKWFASMVSHSDNNILGRSRTHSKVYRRELEYFDLMKSEGFDEEHENTIGTDKLMKLTGMQQHYIDIYNMHNQE
ncbi:sulfotransferase, partial [Paraglaciecola sp.]|uniref:sulfotransferase n=1 Tax=Paraglaciecola sp. TaxID=1920173 RepID=UPI003EF6D21B